MTATDKNAARTKTARGIPSARSGSGRSGGASSSSGSGSAGGAGGGGAGGGRSGRAPEESRHRLVRWWRVLGPGLVTGASDDDPSGIATYAQAGAKYGFGLLWTALITLPLMAAVQETCDRTALATGKTLGELARSHFARSSRAVLAVLISALVAANALNIAADLVAVGSGMALIHAGPAWIWSLAAGLGLTVLLLFQGFAVVQTVFKFLCLSLLAYGGIL